MRLDELRNSAKKQKAVKDKLASADLSTSPDNLRDAIVSYVSPDDVDEFVFILNNGFSAKQSNDTEMIYTVIDNLAKKMSIREHGGNFATLRKNRHIYKLLGSMRPKFSTITLREQIPNWPEELNDSGANYSYSPVGNQHAYSFWVGVEISHNTTEDTWKVELETAHRFSSDLPKPDSVNFKKVFEDGPRMVDFMIPILAKIRNDMRVYEDFIEPYAHKAI